MFRDYMRANLAFNIPESLAVSAATISKMMDSILLSDLCLVIWYKYFQDLKTISRNGHQPDV
jgi:hypothetical protein